MSRSEGKAARKFLRNEAQNSTVRSEAKAALKEPSSMKAQLKRWEKQVLRKQDTEAGKESEG